MGANIEGYDIPEGNSVRGQYIHTAPKTMLLSLFVGAYF